MLFHGWGRRGKRHLIQKDQPCFAAWKQKSKTEKEQKIQHEPHQTGKRRAERHGVNDKKIRLTPAPVVTGLLKIVPEFKR